MMNLKTSHHQILLLALLPLASGLSSCGNLASDGPSLRNGKHRQAAAVSSDYCTKRTSTEADLFVDLRQRLAGNEAKCGEHLARLAWLQHQWMSDNPGLRGDATPHEQIPGTPSFTGASFKDRIDLVGFNNHSFYIAESIFDGTLGQEVWEKHLASVYHRGIIMAPGLNSFGLAISQADRLAVLTVSILSQEDALHTTYYPQQDTAVPVNRFFGERPKDHLARMGAGFPVSVHFPWNCGIKSSPVVAVFALYDLNGKSVAARQFNHEADSNIRPSEVFLIPENPLVTNTVYTAKADVSCGLLRFNRTWTFSTR